jgi:acyl-ACP thioesterase
MKYFYEYEIQHQEVDMNHRLRLFTLENYLLNVAGRVADELGFGIIYLNKQNLTWVLTRMSIEMSYMPSSSEVVVFETWVESNAHMLSTRNFRIYLRKGEERQLIGRAKSVWAVLDLTKREIVNCFDQPAFENMVDGEVLDLPRAARPVPMTEPDDIVEHKIQYSDVDYNGHCNSCKYLETMLNAKLPELDKGFRLDINYAKEVYLGDTLFTHYLSDANGVQYSQKDINGATCCSAKISKL